MPLSVVLYVMTGRSRSELVCRAMAEGIRACGDRAEILPDRSFHGVHHDAAVFYGFIPSLRKVMNAYRAAGRPAIYIDLGYWKREGRTGYHKVAVNARHATAYFQCRKHDKRRAAELGAKTAVRPWRTGQHVLLAGMGPKAAGVEGFGAEQWEREAIATLRQHTSRPIIYRPKPGQQVLPPIAGVGFSDPARQDLATALADCHAVVTHHSNVAVEALVAGVPACCLDGVAVPMAQQDLGLIETPRRPDGREQWVADVAWCQFSVPEMATGLPWRHFKDEGLVPS